LAKERASQTDSRTDMDIYGVWMALAGHAARALTRIFHSDLSIVARPEYRIWTLPVVDVGRWAALDERYRSTPMG